MHSVEVQSQEQVASIFTTGALLEQLAEGAQERVQAGSIVEQFAEGAQWGNIADFKNKIAHQRIEDTEEQDKYCWTALKPVQAVIVEDGAQKIFARHVEHETQKILASRRHQWIPTYRPPPHSFDKARTNIWSCHLKATSPLDGVGYMLY